MAIALFVDRESLILDHFQRNLMGPSGPSKILPRMTKDLVRAGITEKQLFLRLAEKVFFGQKCVFSQFFLEILEMGTFFFAQFFWMWPDHGVQQEVNPFFGARNLGFWPKNPIFAI